MYSASEVLNINQIEYEKNNPKQTEINDLDQVYGLINFIAHPWVRGLPTYKRGAQDTISSFHLMPFYIAGEFDIR